MKCGIATLICLLSLTVVCLGNGVGIINGEQGIFFKLDASRIEVTVENQVAIVKSTQNFINNSSSPKIVKYAFPLPETANATQLCWELGGKWYRANIAATPQDTTIPGPSGEPHPNLKVYLGKTPLYYDFEQVIKKDSSITIELTYVQLLPYEFGKVDFTYPADYSLIQNDIIVEQSLNYTLSSHRTINSLDLLSAHPQTAFTNDGHLAILESATWESKSVDDYRIQYELSLNELGLFGLSTYIPADELPDDHGGFFLFAAEPDPNDASNVINKVFTFIIDHSGSMSGDKIIQARDAATFIVNNLNAGDKFNIVKFGSAVTSFQSSHVDYNTTSRNDALAFIQNISAVGATNISMAFETAAEQFEAVDDNTANIIIFFTDGLPTIGITNTDQLVTHVNNVITQTETGLSVFTFGVGDDVNKQLLTRLAAENAGFAQFVGADDLNEAITAFFLKINNPVLLNTEMSFTPDVISETYPKTLPNLYRGQQFLVSGRYIEPAPVTVTLQGNAFGKELAYEYDLALADSAVEACQFLTKVWAKMLIEDLLVKYYSLDENSSDAEAIKEQTINISQYFDVITPFTSFAGVTDVEQELIAETRPCDYLLTGNYPNPFNGSTKIRFTIHIPMDQIVMIKIYNPLGQLIRLLPVQIHGPGQYEVPWDGLTQSGEAVPSGTYIYIVDLGEGLLSGKMQLMR